MENFYRYKAIIVSVYDGDTCTADIDLGFGIWMRGQKLRLSGIDTPELRGEERERGIEVRDYVRSLILNKEVVIETEKDKTGKYGRWLATIYVGDMNLNEELMTNGMAVIYD
jgi:micrococcal nuclease